MKMSSCAHILLWGLLMLATGHVSAETTAKSESLPQVAVADIALGAWRASQVLGINVYSKDGERVGAIADMVGDVKGRVLYLILSQGGFLGIGDKLIPLPWWMIRPGHIPRTLQVQLNADTLREAPSFDSNAWPDFSQSEWTEKTKNYYQSYHTTDGEKAR